MPYCIALIPFLSVRDIIIKGNLKNMKLVWTKCFAVRFLYHSYMLLSFQFFVIPSRSLSWTLHNNFFSFSINPNRVHIYMFPNPHLFFYLLYPTTLCTITDHDNPHFWYIIIYMHSLYSLLVAPFIMYTCRSSSQSLVIFTLEYCSLDSFILLPR